MIASVINALAVPVAVPLPVACPGTGSSMVITAPHMQPGKLVAVAPGKYQTSSKSGAAGVSIHPYSQHPEELEELDEELFPNEELEELLELLDELELLESTLLELLEELD